MCYTTCIYIHTIYCLQQFLKDLKTNTGVDNLGVMEQLLISDVVTVEVPLLVVN